MVPRAHDTATSTAMLDRLRDPASRTAWNLYAQRFRPMIVRYARRLGLPSDAAEDVAQETLAEFSAGLRDGAYDRRRARLRSWLFGIARNVIRAQFRQRQRAADAAIPGEIDGEPDRWERLWERACREETLRRGLETARREVEPTTWTAFELFTLREWPARRVALELGMTENAVFGAKRRVLARVRSVIQQEGLTW